MTEQRQHPSRKELKQLLAFLTRFEYLFDGTLGTWNMLPINIELKDNKKPVCFHTYPVKKLHKDASKKKL